jgi:hypothetical protein
MSKSQRDKGQRIEREIVDLHKSINVHAERYPLSGASKFRGSGHDIDLYPFGREAAPLVAEVKARKSGGEFDAVSTSKPFHAAGRTAVARVGGDTFKGAAMNAPFEPAHSPFGGSVAARVMGCPASVQLVETVPANLRKTSVFADRGTGLHTAVALILAEKQTLESLAGQTINNYTIVRDDIEDALRPAFAYIDALLDTPGAEFYVEQRVTFPTIVGALGTVDLLVRIGNTIYVVDYKFGAGVRVRALYPDGDVDVINAQLLFYAVAARHSLSEFFAAVETIVLTVLQPMSIESDSEIVSTVEVGHNELDEFTAVYRATCAEALSDTPRLQRGTWCRFCPAKPICPEFTKPLLDLAEFAVPAPLSAVAAPPDKESYLQALAAGLTLADLVKDIRTALHDQAKTALGNGDVVPGYALTAGRAERRWRDDENTTFAALQSLGLTRDDIIAEEMRSVKQVEVRAKARGLKIQKEIQELLVSTRSGTSLTRVENAHAPAPGRDELARSFAEALVAFQESRHK